MNADERHILVTFALPDESRPFQRGAPPPAHVSVLVTGYQFKPSADASLSVGTAPFVMYTQNDGAWVKNAAEEAKLLDTMRKGADVVIKATTSRGTQTTDTFSLKGI